MTEETIKFDALREKITVQVGPPTFSGGEKQKPVLNQQFFAKLAVEVYNPIFEKTEEEFYIYSPETGLWEIQNASTMLERMSDLMMRYASATGDSFVNSKRDASTIRHILSFMKSDKCCGREDAFARTGEPFVHCGNGVITFPVQEDGRRKPTLMPFDPKYMKGCMLVTSCEPCAMCSGATPWSGVERVIYGAPRFMAEKVGFDEGYKGEHWEEEFAKRKIQVAGPMLGEDAYAPFKLYTKKHGEIY